MTSLPPRARLAVGVLLSLPAVVWSADLLAGTPPLILAAALGPAALLTIAILLAQRPTAARPLALVASLAWGGLIAAWLSTTGNSLSRPVLDALSTADDRVLTALLVAPLLEEAAKFLGLLLISRFIRGAVRDARDGIVCGALIGIGFVFTENLLYLGLSMLQGGEPALVRALYLRGVIGAATHAVFTACAGATLGWFASDARSGRGRRWLVPLAGFAFAHLQHLVWNALAAPAIATALCGAESGACASVPSAIAVFGEATVISACFLAPGIAFLIFVRRRSSVPPVPRAD
jgi:RsiW-degrading membrane proteinase PrsW (M82 family)